jgi:four helix bundle protein
MEWPEILRRRTMAFAIAIVRFCRTLPYSIEGDVFRRQLLKAGTSIGANYRASCCGRTARETKAKLGVAVEEADESEYWLLILSEFDLGDGGLRTPLLKEIGEIIRVLAASRRGLNESRPYER